MTEPIPDHDCLDVYRLAIEYTAESFGVAEAQAGYGVEGDDEHRFAEHEHESATKPEPTDGPERRIGSSGMVR